jgi:hypothetical protein
MQLSLVQLRFRIQPLSQLQLPAFNKGNSLRGGFGQAFRRLVCVDLRLDCAACDLRFSCPYTAVFNPFLPPDATQFTGNQNIPRPFVVKPPLSTQTNFAAGEELVFDVTVAGSATEYLPYFIVALRELGASGFGLNRARVRLARVEQIDTDGSASTVFDDTSNLVRPRPPLSLGLTGVGGHCHTLTLNFLTPTTLKAGSTADQSGQIVRRPQFHHVLKRLRDRINALSTFYGEGPLDLDFKAVGEAAEHVHTIADETRWVERSRYSRRRDTPHDLSGFVGRLTVAGELAPFMPLLRAGELLHVGKNAVFGNGWFVIEEAGAMSDEP